MSKMRKKILLIVIMMSAMISTPLFVSSAINFIPNQKMYIGGSGTVDIAQGRSTLSLRLSNADFAEVTLVNCHNEIVYENLVEISSSRCIIVKNLSAGTYTLNIRFEEETTESYFIRL